MKKQNKTQKSYEQTNNEMNEWMNELANISRTNSFSIADLIIDFNDISIVCVWLSVEP